MTNDAEYKKTCEILDKLTIQSLRLMEDKLQHSLAAETAMHEGSFHLAKARYILGQEAVSATRLPGPDSEPFGATVTCGRESQDGVELLQMQENAESSVNPIKWFGVLVPQNLHRAQAVFRSTLRHLVEGANTHVRLTHALGCVELLRRAKCSLKQ